MSKNDTIEDTLERLSEVVSLRASEKDMHRQNLVAFMQKTKAPVHSPLAWLMHSSTRYVAAFALLLVVSSTGVVSAAGGARPGDSLYIVKLKLTEPAQSAFTFDPEEKTAFEVERTDRRLKEFALYSATVDPNPETTALITSSLEESIDAVTEDVSEYAAKGDADIALRSNSDLQSVLSAHSFVLDAIATQNPEAAEDVESVSASVDAGIADTENAENGIESALTPANLDEASVFAEAEDASAAIEALQASIEAGALALDPEDLATVQEALLEAGSVIEEARAARTEGKFEEALLLYTEASQKLDELKTLIEADRDLGIGVIDTDGGQ